MPLAARAFALVRFGFSILTEPLCALFHSVRRIEDCDVNALNVFFDRANLLISSPGYRL